MADELRVSSLRTLRTLLRTIAAGDPARSLAAVALSVGGQVWPILAALGIARAVDDSTRSRRSGEAVLLIGAALAVRLLTAPPIATVAWSLRERATARVERHIVELTSALPGIDHLERPELLDRIAILRGASGNVGRALEALLEGIATMAQLMVTVALLGAVHPVAMLLPLAGIATFAAGIGKGRLRIALDRESGHWWRAKKGLRLLAWAPESGPDLRLRGAGETIAARQDEAVRALRAAHDRWAIKGGLVQCAGDVVFGAAFVGVVAFVARRVAAGVAPPGDLVLVLVLGQRLGAQVARTIQWLTELALLIRALSVLTWLEDASATQRHDTSPLALNAGPAVIAFRDVTFTYPGTDAEVLSGIDLSLRPGTRVAIVGENGAGKSTLVALLCGFYRPTSGKVTIGGVDINDLDRRDWQQRITAIFQDATRLEVEFVTAVGVGDLDGVEPADEPRVAVAAGHAGLADAISEWPDGINARLGRRFPNGVGLSGGQWQKVAHARSTLREEPAVLILDEPTAALDAQAEYDLFKRVRGHAGTGTVTVMVSHRFSTVRDADLIVVLDRGRIIERGTHAELMTVDGHYASMYRRQARHYR